METNWSGWLGLCLSSIGFDHKIIEKFQLACALRSLAPAEIAEKDFWSFSGRRLTQKRHDLKTMVKSLDFLNLDALVKSQKPPLFVIPTRLCQGFGGEG